MGPPNAWEPDRLLARKCCAWARPSHAQVSAVSPVTLWLLTRHDWLQAQQELAAQQSPASASAQEARRGRVRWLFFLAVCLAMTALILGQPCWSPAARRWQRMRWMPDDPGDAASSSTLP